MRALIALLLLALVGTADARPARPRDVKLTITLREQVAVRAWLIGTAAANPEETRDLVALFDDLKLDDARRWIEALPPEKAKSITVDKVPEAKTPVALAAGEARALVKWLAPTEKRPVDVTLGRVLLGFSDAVEDALASK